MLLVLQKSSLARTAGFDLIGEDGWEALRNDIAADFPYLTLADLNATIKLGIKGKLDTYKNRPLNYTRVYQWVEQRTKASRGYWHHHHPELMAWATRVNLADAVLATVFAHPMQEQVGSVLGTIIREAIAKRYLSFPEQEKNAANMAWLRTAAFPAFAAEYPAFAARHPNLF